MGHAPLVWQSTEIRIRQHSGSPREICVEQKQTSLDDVSRPEGFSVSSRIRARFSDQGLSI